MRPSSFNKQGLLAFNSKDNKMAHNIELVISKPKDIIESQQTANTTYNSVQTTFNSFDQKKTL